MENHSSKPILASLLLLSIISSTTTAATGGATNTEFIRTSCSATTYPSLCYTSLAAHAALIQNDHKLLAHTALLLSLDTARNASSALSKLSRSSPLSPRESGAMKDCLEVLSDSADLLRRSMEEMKKMVSGANFAMTMSNVQTWVSAALTDEDTCMEGFEEGKVVHREIREMVRGKVVNVAHMTSNALALINKYAALHG